MSVKYDTSNVKLLSVLAYVGPLFVVGRFSVEKDEDNVRFHVKQGMALFLIVLIAYIIIAVISACLYCFSAFSEIFSLLTTVGVTVAWLILSLMGIIGAFKGERIELPLVSFVSCKLDRLINRR